MVGGPGGADQSAHDGDGVGQRGESGDDAGPFLGADQQFAEAAGAPGVDALDDPADAGLQGEPFWLISESNRVRPAGHG